ncbi:MAG: DUF1702 family protein [Chitinophagales bacterium]|nr:DUF1702 family protein [Chitinophagales bacterium]
MSAETLKNIQTIEETFREVQELFLHFTDTDALVQKLNAYSAEFRSVAFEAASMCIALEDLKNGTALPNWKIFLREFATNYATQFHIGLGWALAQQQLLPVSFLKELETENGNRVLDGYGYYEGMFRRRKSVLQQVYPDWCNEHTIAYYDRGLGRSIWYVSRAEIQTTSNTIQNFPESRQTALWRGIGIAVTYAGGSTESELCELRQLAGIYAGELLKGAELAINSRKEADCMTESAQLALKVWE